MSQPDGAYSAILYLQNLLEQTRKITLFSHARKKKPVKQTLTFSKKKGEIGSLQGNSRKSLDVRKSELDHEEK